MSAVMTFPFETEQLRDAWLASHGLNHVKRLGLWVLAPQVATPFLPQLRNVSSRRLLVELVSADSYARWDTAFGPSVRMVQMLPGLAWDFLERERALAEEARASIPEQVLLPEDGRTHRMHALLLALREKIPASVAPRPPRTLDIASLHVDLQLPGFRQKDARRSVRTLDPTLGFILPEAQIIFSPTGALAECSCAETGCVHALAAIDTALLWLRQAWTPLLGEQLEGLLLSAWERTLRALERAVGESFEERSAVELSWRLEVIDGYGVEVSPFLHRRGRKGHRSIGAKVSRRKLLLEHGAHLSSADARIAALLPDGDSRASRELLLELVNHPAVHLDEAPELLVRVDRGKVGLVAEDRGGLVTVTAGVDGAAFSSSMLQHIKKARPEEVLYLWEAGARRLTVLDAGPEVRAAISVLSRLDNTFPPESHPALLERLSTLSLRMPVAMPRSVMGEAVVPQNLPVLRLEAQAGGAVRLDFLSRPLPDSAAFVPGEGARDVHVRRAAKAVHAVRDFASERASAEALKAQLPLDTAEPLDTPFSLLFESAEGALRLLAACGEITPSPQVEWVGTALRWVGSRGAGSLKVILERKRDWFGVLGGLAVEGERVELATLLDAARRKQRFVKVNATTYVEIEAALREHLERLSDHTHQSRHGLEVGPAGAEALMTLESAGAEVEADKTWRELASSIFFAKALRPRVPTSLKAELRDYQSEGFAWLTRLASWKAGAVLADDMGLGKTVQALAVLLDRARLGPALVLAPTSVAFNWVDEAQRFAPSLKMHLFSEVEDRGAALERMGPRDVLVLSYGLLTRDIERLSAVRFSTLVFDEAQTLKNSLTHRFRAARALHGDFKLALSGTPLENHLGELWALFAVVFPGLLGSWDAFRSRFAAPIEKKDPTAAPALARVLQPFLLRRTKAQVEKQLPPRTDVRVPVVLSAPEWTLYEDARLAALSDLETSKSKLREQERRIEIFAALTRLRLLASHPRLYDPASRLESSKLARFLELTDELRAEGHRALVFSQFTSHLALVREVLDARGVAYEYLDGKTPQRARKERVRAFQEGDAPLFLISLKAGGFGLNLTAATSVIHLDPWWNPAVEDQASDRAHRIGQTRPVTVYRLVARGTIEEQMLALHASKRALVESVLEGKDQAGRLSSRELLGLLSQRIEPRGAIDAPRIRH